jgi:hypothetical protein
VPAIDGKTRLAHYPNQFLLLYSSGVGIPGEYICAEAPLVRYLYLSSQTLRFLALCARTKSWLSKHSNSV